MEYSVTLSVFFCGTGGSLRHQTTQIGKFAYNTDAIDITDGFPFDSTVVERLKGTQLKMAFNGCGEDYGFRGSIFAHGLKEQCQKVVNRIETIIERKLTLCLNCLGLSRGGIATLHLIQMLSDYSLNDLKINACLFDPVPGNLITTTKLFDHLGLTVANKSMDVSKSKNLCSVLALYPHEPLPDIAFHAPIIPKYPSNTWCEVEEDVTLGCHQGALMNTVDPYRDLPSTLSYIRIYRFMTDHGSKIRDEFNCNRLEKACVEFIQKEMENSNCTSRTAHSYIDKTIVRVKLGEYLNKHHMKLMQVSGKPMLMLQIKDKRFIPYRGLMVIFGIILIVLCITFAKK